ENDQANERLLSIVDTIMDNHICPPTRQAMIHNGALAVYRAKGDFLPMGLGSEISALSTDNDFDKFLTELRSKVEKTDSFDDKFLKGMLAIVPGQSNIIPAEQARVNDQLAANRYVGIGIALGMDEQHRPWIMNLLDGPGLKAGVKKNDLILKIDGEPTDGKDIQQIVKELRGEEGSPVVLELQQEDETPRQLSVVRGKTFIPTVEGIRQPNIREWTYRLNANPDIAYLKLVRIGPSTVHELKRIEAKLRSEPLNGIILDLRTGGGLMHDVVMVADQFLDKATLGHVQSRESKTTHETRDGMLFKDVPIAALVSAGSGPDRVYLAAALQDLGRAQVIGQPTQMSAFVRRHIELEGGDKLLLATGLLHRGNGTPLLKASNASLESDAAMLSQQRPVAPEILDHVFPDKYQLLNEETVTLNSCVDLLRKSKTQAAVRTGKQSTSG
ncbi:MAG: S41 family peptidase, partial [Planctomycetota bacterium]